LARRFGANGHPLALEWTAIGGDQYQLAPAVSVNAAGAFVIAAEEDAQGGTQVYAAMYAADGTIQHFAYVPWAWRSIGSNPRTPAVAMQPDGGFTLVWADSYGDRTLEVRDQDQPGVVASRIDNRGEAFSLPFSVNSTVIDVQSEPAVAAAPDGGFVVVWTSGNKSLPAVAAAPDGHGVAVWQSMRRDGDDFGIAARRVSLQP